MPKNQILTWPSWVWKSTICRKLANIQGMNYLDFDDDILEKITQQKAIDIYNILDKKEWFNPYQLINTSVSNILNLVWEDNFNKIEEYLTLQLELKNTVFATSWSQILSDKSMNHLNKMWTTIYLSDYLDNIIKRAKDMKLNRIVWMPNDLSFLNKDQIIKKYKEIMSKRVERYEKLSKVTYNINNKEKKKEWNSVNKNWIPILWKNFNRIDKKKMNNFNFTHFFGFLINEWIIKK